MKISFLSILFSSIILSSCSSASESIDCLSATIFSSTPIVRLLNAEDNNPLIERTINGGLFHVDQSEIFLKRDGEKIVIPRIANTFNIGGFHEPIIIDSLFSLTYYLDLVSNRTGKVDQDTMVINYTLQDLACRESEDEIFPALDYIQILYNNILLAEREGFDPTSFTLLIAK